MHKMVEICVQDNNEHQGIVQTWHTQHSVALGFTSKCCTYHPFIANEQNHVHMLPCCVRYGMELEFNSELLQVSGLEYGPSTLTSICLGD